MALVRSSRRIEASPDEVWQLVTDWAAHSRWIPFTEVTVDPAGPPSGLGVRFVGRSALGPVGFDDPMTVTDWQPPTDDRAGACHIEHQGPWVRGWAEIRVMPDGSATELSWIEEVRPRWTPKFADPVVARIGRVLFDGTLRKLAAEVEKR